MNAAAKQRNKDGRVETRTAATTTRRKLRAMTVTAHAPPPSLFLLVSIFVPPAADARALQRNLHAPCQFLPPLPIRLRPPEVPVFFVPDCTLASDKKTSKNPEKKSPNFGVFRVFFPFSPLLRFRHEHTSNHSCTARLFFRTQHCYAHQTAKTQQRKPKFGVFATSPASPLLRFRMNTEETTVVLQGPHHSPHLRFLVESTA